jgi:hypothetical protein
VYKLLSSSSSQCVLLIPNYFVEWKQTAGIFLWWTQQNNSLGWKSEIQQAVSPFKRITNFKLELIALETLHMSDTAFKQNT